MFDLKIGDIISQLLSKDSVIAELFKGKESKLQEFQIALIKELKSANSEQIELNKIEAKHPSLFVAGWRPFIGWICGFSLMYNYIFQPLLFYITQLFDKLVDMPKLDTTQLMTILTIMLGMSGYRTYEKIKLNGKLTKRLKE